MRGKREKKENCKGRKWEEGRNKDLSGNSRAKGQAVTCKVSVLGGECDHKCHNNGPTDSLLKYDCVKGELTYFETYLILKNRVQGGRREAEAELICRQ